MIDESQMEIDGNSNTNMEISPAQEKLIDSKIMDLKIKVNFFKKFIIKN